MLFVLYSMFLFLLYLYGTKNQDYWAKRKVKFDKPLPFFGNHLKNVLLKRFVVGVGVEMYTKYPEERMVGYFRGRNPELVLRDPDLIKHILSSDFPYFHSRGYDIPDKEPLVQSMFFTNGGKWWILRQRMSAAFSTGKIKSMFPLVLKCTEKLQDTAKNLVISGNEIDAYDLMGRYTMEFIGSCGFGVELDTIKTKHSNFLEEAKLFFTKTKWQTFLAVLKDMYPMLGMLYEGRMIRKPLSDTFIHITKKVRENRGLKSCGKNDFIDILLDIESKGKITMESPYERNPDQTPKKVTLEMNLECTAAQVFTFMLGGFKSSASVTSFTLHQLAFSLGIQTKIQEEIDSVLSKYGKLSYEAINEMALLGMALKEALRMMPTAGLIRRECTRTYTIPGTDVTIDPGVRIYIPVQALHMDPQYFDSPKEYRPERFAPDNMKPNSYVYLPFGEGPRKCPASRLGYMQSIAGLAAILQRFTVLPGPTSQRQYTTKKTSFLVQIKEGGVPLKFVPRNELIK